MMVTVPWWFVALLIGEAVANRTWPVMVATWDKKSSVDSGWEEMMNSYTNYKALDGVVGGVKYCQTNCNPGGANIDSNDNVTQSAMVIWGAQMSSGSVVNIYDIDDAVGVAKDVLFYTEHAILSGEAATKFAIQNGYKRKNLKNGTNAENKYENWINSNCSYNYWRNVLNGNQCLIDDEIYEQMIESEVRDINGCGSSNNNDKINDGMVTGSISMIAIDEYGQMAIATSSNGLNYKIAGRISNVGIPGAGGYINPFYGGCVATGDGDIIIRHNSAMRAVMYMEFGRNVSFAAQTAVNEVEEWCGDKQIMVLCLDKNGNPGFGVTPNEGGYTYAYRSSKCTQAVSADQTHPTGSCT